MTFNNRLLSSTVLLALMATGCVKKQENVTPSGTYNPSSSSSESTTIYDTTTAVGNATYDETAGPLIYDTGSGVTTNNNSTYSEVIPNNTVITTGNSGTAYGSGEVVDSYNDTQSNGAYSTNGSSSGGGGYSYGGYSSGTASSSSSTPSYSSGTDYSSPPSSTQSYSSGADSSYSTPPASSSYSGGGISLQVAALKDYYAAKEFKNSLSLDPKYSVSIKRVGGLNKVIVSGISSVAEANRLKERRFPGAFIVHNSGGGSSSYSSSSSSSYTPPASSNSSYGSSTYSDNSSYGSYSSSSSSSSYGTSSGSVGVQIGAFGNRAKAQSVADRQHGKHPAVVKKIGKLYKVILTGFSNYASAKAYSSRVGGFVVSSF